MRKLAYTLALACLIQACGLFPNHWGDRVPTIAPEVEANRPVVTIGPDGLTLTPISARGALFGQPYAYDMSHCGIASPIDIDGSFWDPIDYVGDPVVFDGAPGTFTLLDHDHATFTTRVGAHTVNLSRHDGPKAFPFCA